MARDLKNPLSPTPTPSNTTIKRGRKKHLRNYTLLVQDLMSPISNFLGNMALLLYPPTL